MGLPTTAESLPKAPAPQKWARIPAFSTFILAAAVLAFYFWTASSSANPFDFQERQTDYYNLLVEGFRAGHLSMNSVPDPGLLSPDPAVRSRAPYLLDASLYQGRYYLYFGVTPAATLFLPWSLLTGHGLPENLAAALLASAGFAFSLFLLWDLRRCFFPTTGNLAWAAIVIAAGLANLAPTVLRRGAFYEVAVLSAYACSMLYFLGCWLALRGRTGQGLGLVIAGFSAALGVGSRPNLICAGLLLPFLAWAAWRLSPAEKRTRRRLLRSLLLAGVPAAIGMSALFLYNFQRFGSPFEFGHSFQLGSNPNGFHFTWENFRHNLRLYYLTWPEVSRYFPFFSPGTETARPEGYWGIEQIHGQLLSLGLLVPFVVCLWCRRTDARALAPVIFLCLMLLFCFAGNGAIIAATGVRSNRYMMDFHPELLLGVCLGVLGLAGIRTGFVRWLVRGSCGLLLLLGFYNAMISLQTSETLRQTNLPAYASIARVFNYPSWWWQQAFGAPPGPLRLKVAFPAGQPGTLEPLVSTGTSWFSDTLYVRYDGPGIVRFILEHADHGSIASPPVSILPGQEYALEVGMGSLYPPEEHPFFEGLARGQMRLIKHTAVISLDGREVMHGSSVFFDASPGQVQIGENRLWPTMKLGRFTGRLEYLGRRPVSIDGLRAQARTEVGPVLLQVALPRDRFGTAEPLVVTGDAGRADVLFVHYVDETHVRFGLDHWGSGVTYSPAVEIDYTVPHRLQLHLGSLYPSDLAVDPALRRRFAVLLDDRPVIDTQTDFYPADRLAVDIGVNSIGASSCRVLFGGEILSSRRLSLAPNP